MLRFCLDQPNGTETMTLQLFSSYCRGPECFGVGFRIESVGGLGLRLRIYGLGGQGSGSRICIRVQWSGFGVFWVGYVS